MTDNCNFTQGSRFSHKRSLKTSIVLNFSFSSRKNTCRKWYGVERNLVRIFLKSCTRCMYLVKAKFELIKIGENLKFSSLVTLDTGQVLSRHRWLAATTLDSAEYNVSITVWWSIDSTALDNLIMKPKSPNDTHACSLFFSCTAIGHLLPSLPSLVKN